MIPIVPPPLGRRPSTGKLLILAVGGFATAAGGAAWATSSAWIGGIATRGYVDAKVADELSAVRQMAASCDARSDEILTEVRVGNTRQLERVGTLLRERVGLQVALHVGIDPKRRDAAQQAAVNARAKFDELVLKGSTPEDAADRVLEYARIPR